MPADANAGGSVFGGWTLSQMDLAGGNFAAERGDGRVVTTAIEAMRFLRPITIGDEVSCYCTLEDTGDTSIQVKIETWARSRGRGKTPEKVTEGIFTFVAIDEHGRPRTLAPDPNREE
jgi:acyl-CoA thioesterase YciA